MALTGKAYVNEKILDGEPFFPIRAQDRFAPALVRLWADLVEAHYGGTRRRGDDAARNAIDDKVAEARSLAMRMERWPKRKFPD